MRRGAAPQGEALVTWALAALVCLAVVITYARLDPAELYHVSNEGLRGGLSRALVLLNFPVSLIAIGLALVALGALPLRAWLVGGPAIALCAVTAVPGVVDQDDLDARLVNAVPAAGVLLTLGLTLAAARETGSSVAPRRSLDRVRAALGVAILLVSIPWLAAEAGVFVPEGVFIMERPGVDADGTTIAAVHLGHHHGLDGALIVASALLLSRAELRGRVATAARLYLSLAVGYGLVNLAQDAWNEQLVKRDVVDWRIPSALEPRPEPVWLVIIGLAALVAVALSREATVDSAA